MMGSPGRNNKGVEKDAKHFKKDNRHIGPMYSSTSTQTIIVNVVKILKEALKNLKHLLLVETLGWMLRTT